jgi:5-bromo-4-chloroindolyl phosphate hydrolysis protein
MFGSEDIFPTKVYEKNGKVLIRKNAISNRLVSIPGAVHGFVMIFTVLLTIVIFFYSSVFTKCRRGAKVEAETQDSQGTYIDELEVIKKHGLHTYEILENLDYRHLILSLNSAAENVQTLRHTLTKRSEYLERLKKIGK